MAAASAAVRRGSGRVDIAQLDFFYDVASPYSWLAFETLLRYRNVWDTDINLRPFFLGGVMKATGNKPPATVKAKGLYMRDDLQRMARFHGVPLTGLRNPRDMYDTLDAQRLLTAASMEAPAQLEGLTRQLWTRLWGGGGEVSSAESLKKACEAAGLHSDASRFLLARSGDTDVKDRLKEATAEAIETGAFGAPWIVLRVNGAPTEAFFGCDRFEVLAKAMGQPWLGPDPTLSKI